MESQRSFVEEPILLVKILKVISLLNKRKTPGFSGLLMEVYKRNNDLLAPALLHMYNATLYKGTLSSSHTKAVVLILKPEQEPLDCELYLPIALLNTDYKILTRILVSRLNTNH